MAHNSVSHRTIVSKRSQMQSSLASIMIIAVFKRNSVGYTSRISSLSAIQFTI